MKHKKIGLLHIANAIIFASAIIFSSSILSGSEESLTMTYLLIMLWLIPSGLITQLEKPEKKVASE